MSAIDLSELGSDHVINRAMRRIARYWAAVYAKLLCLNWVFTDEKGYHPKARILIPYMATDGITLFINPTGLEKLIQESLKEVGEVVGYVAFGILHEGLHAILNHGFRLDKFTSRKTANEAADYKVNEMIHQRNEEIGKVVFPLPSWVLLDLKMSEPHTTEKLYQYLRKDELEEEMEEESPEPGAGHPDPDGEEGTSDEKTEEDNTGDGDSASGSDAADGSGEPDVTSLPGAGGVDTFKPEAAGIGEEELEAELEEQNERLMIQDALDTHSHGIESAATRRIAKERRQTEPQDWASYAEQFVQVKCDKGWKSPYNHGVYISTGLAAPGREGRKVGDIVCVSDSSGSIGPEAWQKFFELNQYILDDIEPNRVLLVSCAEEVKDYTVLEPGDKVPKKMNGGGGTSFREAFKWIEKDPHDLCIDPLLLIYFTDGLCNDHKTMTEPEYPVLWLSYKAEKDNFPWGEFSKILVS